MIEEKIAQFQIGDIIRNKKTDKLCVVVDPDVAESTLSKQILKYHLLDDYKNVHTGIDYAERFELFYRAKRVHWSYYSADLFD